MDTTRSPVPRRSARPPLTRSTGTDTSPLIHDDWISEGGDDSRRADWPVQPVSFCDRLASRTAVIFMSHRGMDHTIEAPIAAIAKCMGPV